MNDVYDPRKSVLGLQPDRLTYIAANVLLWGAFLAFHFSEDIVSIPKIARVLIWSGLLGAAACALAGRIVLGAVLGTLLIPVALLALLFAAFAGDSL